MDSSILNDVKQLNGGIESDDTSFDMEIMTHINSVFMDLASLGVGPTEGYFITGSSEKWSDYVNDPFIAHVIMSYIAIQVKLVFDTPTNKTVVDALQKTADKQEYKIRQWIEQQNNIV